MNVPASFYLYNKMDSSNQSVTHPAQLSSQGYNHQMQPMMWGGGKVCQNSAGQNTNLDPYSQQMNHYYPASYPQQNANEINRYLSVSKDQNPTPVTYSSQYPAARQSNYSYTNPSQNYHMNMKTACNNIYYGNVNTSKYSTNNVVQSPKKYNSSSLGLPQAPSGVPQSPQVSHNSGAPMPQMPHYGDQNSYHMQNLYVNNCATHTSGDTQQGYILQQPFQSPTALLSSQDNVPIHTTSITSANQVSQVSSIPTPPETSSLPGDSIPVMDITSDGSADSIKMNTSAPSFALPGSAVNHMPSPVSTMGNNSVISSRNTGASLQPPANLDEGSQASSASASSSIPDEQNSAKTNSKPNFSYPPTPNTLSSPGAASMSSFHDDLECISSPGWPKTPASPVANSSYEFSNIKRPENLLKLYTLSDEPDRRYFLDKLIVFNEDRGSPITQCPTISKQPLDVYRVYLTVKEHGGFVEVTNAKRWKDIAGAIGVGASSSAAYTLRKQYMKLLLPFECKFDRGGVDPQPIINMVEASSRKKGKNSLSNAYGNQNHYNQGYPQVMDRYHSGYSSSPYQSSRYSCNSNEYHCASNAMHYPQTASHNSASGHSHYNQYSHNSQGNYGYYQGSNSASSVYNNNLQSNNNNVCRYGSNSSSSVPQEQGYYPHQYPSSQGQNMQENVFGTSRTCSMQENVIAPSSNQVPSDREPHVSHPKVSSSINAQSLSSVESSQYAKPSNVDNFNMNVDCSANNNSESSQEKACFNTTYGTANKTVASDANSVVSNTSTSAAISQSYPLNSADSALSKMPDVNYYSPSSASHQNISYSNQSQSPYSGQSSYSGYQDFHGKDQMQSGQYSRYTEAQNETYRGSEGPPSLQTERRNSTLDGSSTTSKAYQYNCSAQKTNSYNYGTQQGASKELFNSTAYSNQFASAPQRGWHPDQAQYSYQHGQRSQLKSQVNMPDAKQNSDVSRMRKPWINSRDATQSQKLPCVVPSATVQNQASLPNKSQSSTCAVTVSQAFQSMVKKPMEFPPNCVESIRAVAVKRRRCPAKKLGPIDPWRLMMGLKSGLLAESTWALDALAILLADNATVVYFGLKHLPGLLNVLVDHYRCLLNKIFHLANDMEIGESVSSEKNTKTDKWYLESNETEERIKILESCNYTYKTRCKKKVEILYDEALFLIDPQNLWDKFEGFDVPTDHWQKGGGDTTSHIQFYFDTISKNVKFFRELTNEKSKHKKIKVPLAVKSLPPVIKDETDKFKSSSLYKGEPIVVLEKFNFLTNKIYKLPEKSNVIESSFEITSNINVAGKEKVSPIKENESSSGSNNNDVGSSAGKVENKDTSKEVLCKEENVESTPTDVKSSENCPQLRGSVSSRKRFLCEDLEDEAYCFDHPALCVMTDSQEMLSRRCVCVSTILRNLSFVPGNDLVMSKNAGILLLLGRLLLLHHEHKPTKAYRKYESDGNVSWNDSCTSLKDEQEWWWGTLNILRDNTLVILSNISGQLDLAPFPEEVSLPILDGLLHWIICPSSYAQDPLPSRSPSSVLSPQRLSLEALCKLSVLSGNVDLIIATPPWSRIESLLAFLTKSLSYGQDEIMREFAIILLSNISQADTVAARTIAEQSCCISYLIGFIEEAEANAFQIASSQGTKKLRDKPELMGTTPGMVQRAANTLKNLAIVPENQALFTRHQSRLLSLVMTQVMDQELTSIIADVLFYCSAEVTGDISSQLPVS